MARSRLISEFIALLIIIGIVVGVGVAIALMAGSVTQHTTPKGSVLLIHSVKVYSIGSSTSRTLLIKVAGSVSGNSPINITSVSVSWNTGSVAVTSSAVIQAPAPGTYIKPGSLVEIQATLQTSAPPANYATVWVIIVYCDPNGSCGSVTGTGTVVPYTT